MTYKHVTGPWAAQKTSVWSANGDTQIAIIKLGNLSHATYTANARLIAAAPELLEALEDSERIISFALNNGMIMGRQHKHDAESHLDGIRAAIRKARGEQS